MQNWDLFYKTKNSISRVNKFFLDNLLRKIDLRVKNTPILDLGCGNGDLALKLAKRGFSVYGMDASKEALGIAQKSAEDQKLSRKTFFYQADIAIFPYSEVLPKKFPVIFCRHTLAFIKQKQKFLRYTKKLLDKDGVFVLIIPVIIAGAKNLSQKTRNISIRETALEKLLKNTFSNVSFFHTDYNGDDVVVHTYICRI